MLLLYIIVCFLVFIEYIFLYVVFGFWVRMIFGVNCLKGNLIEIWNGEKKVWVVFMLLFLINLLVVFYIFFVY